MYLRLDNGQYPNKLSRYDTKPKATNLQCIPARTYNLGNPTYISKQRAA
jgi:hypothetical protein